MIRYQVSNGNAFPRVFCNVCEKPIDDPFGLAHISDSGEITFAHAGRCDRKVKTHSGVRQRERKSNSPLRQASAKHTNRVEGIARSRINSRGWLHRGSHDS
jgi:hypothetical protein